jgi:hypothetical protein
VPHLLGIGDHVHVLVGDVLEEREQVDFLLVVAAERRSCLLADDRDHRLVVELGVVAPVQEVDRAGAEVARQTPTSPMNFACPQAMKADISSCRTWMNSIRSLAPSSAPMIPLIPSPG